MLLQQANVMPHFALGGQVQQNLSPADMQASMIVNGQTPQRFALGGPVLSNMLGQTALALPTMQEDAQNIAADIKTQKYPEAAAKTAGSLYSAFAPVTPLTSTIYGLTYSPEVGDATLKGWAEQEAYRKAKEQYDAELKASRPQHHGRAPLSIEQTRFNK
jgi:hypothetical protein